MKINAKWITSPEDIGAAVCTCKKSFIPRKKNIKRATLYASAMGIYTAYINGVRLGNGVFAPGWTSYNFRTQYQKYDVTKMLNDEVIDIELGLGRGWAVGFRGVNYYTDHTSVIAWLEVVYKDGEREMIATDETWDVYTSCVTYSEIYHGETVDLTAEIRLLGKAVISDVKTKLIAQVGEWITEQERLTPIDFFVTPKGERVLDFGQNITGYVEIRIQAPKGSRIVLHHAEVLDQEKNFYTENYRGARNENIFVCSGGKDVFKPAYSFQGFRYVQLVEYPFETVDLECFRAVVVHSDIKRTGTFVCGNPKINQLYHNIVWGQKGNYLDIPTDCPQRDERLGWTADTQVFCRTGAINYDVERFFDKWMGDVAVEQTPEGGVRGVVPRYGNPTRICAAWGDAACIVPWEIYLAYGNKKFLSKYFPVMKKWVDYIHSYGPEEYLWLGGRHFGDWLAMDSSEDSYFGATSSDLLATVFFAHSTNLLIQAGEVLGKDMADYRKLYDNILSSFHSYFMENGMPKQELPLTEKVSNGRIPDDNVRLGITQTSLALILHFNMCYESERARLAAKLVELIRENGMRMTTGFVGTPYLLHALSENGYTDVAYALLMQEKNPSWLYSVNHGATTIWEHWNGIKEDGSFWSAKMNSFNHYAYGAVYDWIFGVACGIKTVQQAPAYRKVTIEPHPNECLGFVDTSIETRNGKIRVHWYYKEKTVHYEFEIPSMVTAFVKLPSGYSTIISGGCFHFAEKSL